MQAAARRVKAIMAMLSAAEREGRLLEEEGRLGLEAMAESPLLR
jgi:hypothetical protein